MVPGVVEARLDLGRSLARVTWDPAIARLSAVAGFFAAVGYPCHPSRGVDRTALQRRDERGLLIRLAAAGAIAGNVMLLAFALYGGAFQGPESSYGVFFRWVSLLLAAPSVAWCAAPFHRGAWGSLRARRLHMDVPISIGVLAGFLWGAFNTVRGAGEVYFDSVTVLVFLLLAGRFLQGRQQRAAARASELLLSLVPATARRLTASGVQEVAVEALTIGDRVEILTGASVPVDGVVLEGHSSLDRSLLTGESRPESAGPGSEVHSGTVNLSGRLVAAVTATGEETRVGRLMMMVEEASRRKAPAVLAADRISGLFVVVVLALAVITFGLWIALDPERAVGHAVAVLIVSCPCALGLATPLAVAAAIGAAARRGILIKGGDALELLATPSHLLLDKTGTLTEGRFRVVEWVGDRRHLALAAAVEQGSAHPVARALVEAADDMVRPPVGPVEEVIGGGVRAYVDGREVTVGSPGFVTPTDDPQWLEAVQVQTMAGLTPVVVTIDGNWSALAGLGDPLRGDSAQAVAALRARGFRTEVLSGDHPTTVARAASAVGLDEGSWRGGATPEAKLEAVESALAAGPVVMVGDGVNDAAALARATVGIGVHGGAEAALTAADVWLGRPGLGPLVELVDGARRTRSVIRRNLVLSLAYNAVAVSCAVAGMMSPLLAAVLMPLSSMTVVVSSYRARTFPRHRR